MESNSKLYPQRIMWLQVGGLAGIQGAITLCWLIYNLYIPKLLGEVGFDPDVAIGLLAVENKWVSSINRAFGGWPF